MFSLKLHRPPTGSGGLSVRSPAGIELDNQIMGVLSEGFAARQAEIRGRHERKHAALQTEFAEQQNNLTALIKNANQMMEDLGDIYWYMSTRSRLPW